MVGGPHRECETGQERFICATTPFMQKHAPLHVSLVAIPDAVVSTLSGIFDVLGAFRMLGFARAVDFLPSRPSHRDCRGEARKRDVGERHSRARTSCCRRNRGDGHHHRAVRAAGARRLGDRPLPRDRRLGPAQACTTARCCARPARESFSLPRPGCSTARRRRFTGATRESSHARFPGPAESRARAGGFGRARGTDNLGRLDDVARSRALSDRASRRCDGGADHRANIRPAMAS